jgi:hypothetical protein
MVNIKITVLWGMMVCSLVDRQRRNVLPPQSASGRGSNIFLWHGVAAHEIVSFRGSKNEFMMHTFSKA